MSTVTARRVLLVIDVQNEYVDGGFRIEYPDVSSSLANIGKAMDAATRAGIPVVAVQHIRPPEAPIFARGSAGADLHPVVAERHFDHLIEKTLPSTFAGTDFGAWLTANEINTITVVGYMTHNCNDSTIRQAMHEGYAVEFLPDAAGSLPYKNAGGSATARHIHETATVVIASTFAAVLTTGAWIDLLGTGKAAPLDNIYSSNQRALADR